MFLWDTAVFLYARGREHAYREPCRRLVELARDGRLLGNASVELLQEYAHILLRRHEPRADVVESCEDVAALCRLRAFDRMVLDRALELIGADTGTRSARRRPRRDRPGAPHRASWSRRTGPSTAYRD